MITLHGIPNCDTIKKARTWLDTHGATYVFHDFKKQGVSVALLSGWVDQVGWEKLLNRQGTTWRKLDSARQQAIHDAESAIALMIEQPSIIKRPVLVTEHAILVGFDADAYHAALA
jgi:arsenate reductase